MNAETPIPAAAQPLRARACVHDAQGVEQLDHVPLDQLAALAVSPPDGRVRWLRVEGFEDGAYLQAVAAAFGIHDLVMEDVQHAAPTPKLEAYENGYFLVLPRIRYERRLRLEQVSLFLGEGWVLSFAPSHVAEFDQLAARLAAGRGRVREGGADRLLHHLTDVLVDGYAPVLTAMDEAYARLDVRLQGRRPDAVVFGLRELRADLFRLHTLLRALQGALTALQTDRDDWLDDAVQPYIKDVNDHVGQSLAHVENLREAVAEAQQLYQALLNQRTNDTMRVLTVMSAIFLPLSFIAGVYGMNFQHMPELTWMWGYPFALGLMSAVALGLLVFFARKGWLGSPQARANREARRRSADASAPTDHP